MTFSVDISNWIRKAKGREDLVVRKISLDIFSRVVLRSPVDTGRFRGNWQVAIGSVPSGVLEVNDKSGQATISKIQATVLGLRAGDVITLVNNLPYGPRLEHGWSKQAPSGMVKVTLTEFQTIVQRAARAGGA